MALAPHTESGGQRWLVVDTDAGACAVGARRSARGQTGGGQCLRGLKGLRMRATRSTSNKFHRHL